MKKLLFFLFLFLITSFSRLFSQSGNIVNGDFSQYVNPNNTTTPCNILLPTGCTHCCPSFSNQCLVNWNRLYGSPQLVVPTFSKTLNNYIYMWVQTNYGGTIRTEGEGILGGYNFVANQNYHVDIRVSAYSNPDYPGSIGGFNIFAANGLIGGTSEYCSDPIPVQPGPSITNGSIQVNTGIGNWQVLNYSFTPNAQFTQISIAPFCIRHDITSEKYDLNVDYINVYPDNCTGTINYNNTTINTTIPTGPTRAGYINVNNSATTVSSNLTTVSSSSTDLIAGNAVDIKSPFDAQASGSGYFHAAIGGCNSARGAKDENQIDLMTKRDNINTLKYNVDDNFKKAEIKNISKVYPNPAKDKLIVNYNFTIGEKSEIKIINSVGIVVKKLSMNSTTSNQKQTEINVKNLSDGVYFIIIKSGTKVYREKFIKIN